MSIFYQDSPGKSRIYISLNINYAPHLHRQIELLTVLEGQLTVTVEQTSYELHPGQGVIVFPNQIHSLKTPCSSKILLVIFEADFCHGFRQQFQKGVPQQNDFSLKELSPHSSVAADGLIRLTREFERGTSLPEPTLTRAKGYLTLLLTDVLPSLTLLEKTDNADLALEQQVLLYLDSHFTENLTLELLSRKFGVSIFRLSRLFSKHLNMSFTHYVNSRRLEYAKDLLANTELSVTQIALDTGFGSSRTFFREFRQVYSVTPGEYRRIQLLPEPEESLPLF